MTDPTRRSHWRSYAVAFCVFLLGGCTDTVGPDPSESALEVVTDALSSPVDFVAVPGTDQDAYIVEKAGRVRALIDGVLLPDPVLDITSITGAGSERGLLGLAFSPDFQDPASRHVFLNHTALDGATRIVRYTMMADNLLDPASAVEVLRVEQPFSNHNGGQIAFGPDGMLYIGMGDGGDGGDPQGHGQNRATLLGSMLRIDVSSLPYSVPADNPFVQSPGVRGEIWAYGLRNPWRFSFDPFTGDLWIGDVGQGEIEEVSRLSPSDAGANLGWAIREGTRCFAASGCNAPGFTDPVYEYTHDDGCSITGGHVYRGPVESLRGRYVFGDFCDGWIRSFDVADPGSVYDHSTEFGAIPSLSAFGVDGVGHLYVLSLTGTVWRVTGD